MHFRFVRYELQNGFVSNWLAAGPYTVPLSKADAVAGNDTKLRIARRFYDSDSGITSLPVERGPLTEGTFKIGDYTGLWSYVRCREDHLVDHTSQSPACHYVRSWAYAEIVSPTACEVKLILTTHGPADIWLNAVHTHRQEHFHDQRPISVSFQAKFERGANRVLVRFEGVTLGESPHVIALRITPPDSTQPISGMRVRLPTTMEKVSRRNTLEQAFQAAYLDRDIFNPTAKIVVQWPEEMNVTAITTVRLQSPSGRIYAETHERGSRGEQALLTTAARVPEGLHHVVLMPGPKEFYEGNRRIARELPVWCLGGRPFSESIYGTLEERRKEALEDAAKREGDLFSQIAKMALGRWDSINVDTLQRAVDEVRRCPNGNESTWVGLVGMLYRFSHHPQFPEAIQPRVEECVLQFNYLQADGSPTMPAQRCLLLHTAEVLAGQLFPDRSFNDNHTGQWHRERGEQLALDGLLQHAANGFEAWDSPVAFAQDLIALSHLVDLAEDETLQQMAALIMDKIFFTLALNSYKGVFGSTHGSVTSRQVCGGLLEATSGISRLMWGQGMFNHHSNSVVSLACLSHYELPSILSDIANALPEEVWNRERHGTQREVNKVTYKTADYMLCSAQDYFPGATGAQEHIWQATLGPEAVVFVTHPACARDQDGPGPDFWAGNAILPRVAQWKDMLIAIHRLPAEDWMGFTHAYFPLYAFDEYALKDGWAFARKGNGYLALTAQHGLTLIQGGHSAYRELRSFGEHNVWLCQMGRAALDGNFEDFQSKVLNLEITFDDLAVQCQTLRGDTLALGWEGPFRRNEEELPLAGFKHYENPYASVEWPCSQMEIQFEDSLLRLDFGEQPSAD